LKPRSTLSLTSLVCLLGIIIYACSPTTYNGVDATNGEGAVLLDGTVFTRAALLDAFGTCIYSEIEAFEAQSQVFAQAAHEAMTNPEQAQSDEVRLSWEATIDIWQRLELMQLGPAGRKTHPGGRDLRASIYSWPHRDHCEIDRNLTTEIYGTTPNDVSKEAKGLWAAEYLLFATGTTNACEPDDAINMDGSWATLDESVLALRRANYAALTANTVADTAAILLEAWSPTVGDFLGELTQAGEGSRTYGKKRVAINAVSDALGYLEWGIKDNKLARPLGIIGCGKPDCSDYLEATHSRRSKEHLRNNMIGFRKLFKGCGDDNTGLGFDDYLFARGAESIGQEIDAATRAVLDAIDTIEEPDLVSALANDEQSVRALHGTLSTLSTLLRNEFIIVLNLELPQMVQGDND
jgi:uncharacterized protein